MKEMKKGIVVALVTVAFCAVGATEAHAGPMDIDQVNPPGTIGANNTSPLLTWQQEVVVGVAGDLVGIDVYPGKAGRTATFFVNAGSAWQADANDFEMTYTSAVGLAWDFIDVSSAGLVFNVGDTFVWGTVGTNGGLNLRGSVGVYTPGRLFLNGPAHGDGTADLSFRTHVTPEPASLVLSVLGGLGVLVVARRRRKHA